MRKLLAIIVFAFSTAALAETSNESAKEATPPKADVGLGICMGIATRCDLLPKGICYMQSGCGNPMYGDRCVGTARQCTQFNGKNACFMQRGCTWVKGKK